VGGAGQQGGAEQQDVGPLQLIPSLALNVLLLLSEFFVGFLFFKNG